VQDYSRKHITTQHYFHDTSILDFELIWKRTKMLLSHPACTHLPDTQQFPCEPCEDAFTKDFWLNSANMLDYFAGFAEFDTPLARAMWFHLVDTWQETASWFPKPEDVGLSAVSVASLEAWHRAMHFKADVEETVELFETVIQGRWQKERENARENEPTEPVIHPPSGDGETIDGYTNTGPWISGLKPWEQFLSDGGPGVALDEEEGKKTCYVPLPAINIIQTYTAKARAYARMLHPDDPAFLARFDEHTVKIPTEPETEVHTYQNEDGATLEYRLTDGAPPIMRHRGWGSHERQHPNPTFSMLDDFVGICRARQPFPSVSGGEDEDEEGEGALVPFDMWKVTEQKKGEEGGEF
jgi:hypothetical protein